MNILARMRIIPRLMIRFSCKHEASNILARPAVAVHNNYIITSKPMSCTISTTPCLRERPSLVKLRKLQADYQCEDGKPIWLKRGITDRILYTSTIVGCGLGLVLVILTIYDHAKPESWKVK